MIAYISKGDVHPYYVVGNTTKYGLPADPSQRFGFMVNYGILDSNGVLVTVKQYVGSRVVLANESGTIVSRYCIEGPYPTESQINEAIAEFIGDTFDASE